jgi:hypothetical protein
MRTVFREEAVVSSKDQFVNPLVRDPIIIGKIILLGLLDPDQFASQLLHDPLGCGVSLITSQ